MPKSSHFSEYPRDEQLRALELVKQENAFDARDRKWTTERNEAHRRIQALPVAIEIAGRNDISAEAAKEIQRVVAVFKQEQEELLKQAKRELDALKEERIALRPELRRYEDAINAVQFYRRIHDYEVPIIYPTTDPDPYANFDQFCALVEAEMDTTYAILHKHCPELIDSIAYDNATTWFRLRSGKRDNGEADDVRAARDTFSYLRAEAAKKTGLTLEQLAVV